MSSYLNDEGRSHRSRWLTMTRVILASRVSRDMWPLVGYLSLNSNEQHVFEAKPRENYSLARFTFVPEGTSLSPPRVLSDDNVMREFRYQLDLMRLVCSTATLDLRFFNAALMRIETSKHRAT